MEGTFRQDLVVPPWTIVNAWTPDIATAYASPTPYSLSGELVCSSSQELETWPSIVWDVNGYYWALGVDFRATRRQLADAYREKGGENDSYLTYVFSQLLNPEVRRRYDARPLGSVFWDKYVDAKVRSRAHRLALRLDVDADQILKQWGYEEKDELAGQDGHSLQVDIPKESGEDEGKSFGQGYTFYMWRMKRFVISEEDLLLSRKWRKSILEECYQHQTRARFAVGIMGSPRAGSDIALLSVAGATVLFVSTTVETDDIARLAVIARQLLVH